jgi:putative nucleotidyltransferase with HDIG domain
MSMPVTESCPRQVPLVAVVDGNHQNRGQVANALISFYRVVQYIDADQALRGLRDEGADLALVDDQTPGGGGYNLVRAMRRDRMLETMPVILTSGQDERRILGAVKGCGASALLLKPYRRSKLIATVTAVLNRQVEERWARLPSRPRTALKETINVFNSISDAIDSGQGIDYRLVDEACSPLLEAVENDEFKDILEGVKDHDNYTFAHSLKVATLLSLFGTNIGLSHHDALLLTGGGLLHDVGKMTIPHEVLNKPGQLKAEEFEVMKSHVPASMAMLQANDSVPKGVAIIAGQHHEKLDGSGYPKGLKGRELNELARMSSIVDIFCALTDRRVYKPPMGAGKALEIMTEGMSSHLDQNLLKMFRVMMLDAVPES